MVLFFLTLSMARACLAAAEPAYYVCKAGDASYIGRYELVEPQLYANENGKALFRHSGFWYFGDTEAWPPVTDYRCVTDCPLNEDTPPLHAQFTVSSTGIDPAPNVSMLPCGPL